MQSQPFKESNRLTDRTFPIKIFFPIVIHHHWHDHMEWVFIQQGKFHVQIDADFAEMDAGELVFVNPRQIHCFTPLVPDSKMIAIVFNEALVRNSGLDSTEVRYFADLLNSRSKLPNFINSSNSLCKDIISSITLMINELIRMQPGYELFIKSALYHVFGIMFRNESNLALIQNTNFKRNEIFSDLLDYLRDNYDQEISVTTSAKKVSMSPNYFCSVFKKITGKTLIEYVNLLRVHEAEKLLLETDLSIMDISEKVGFGNLTYFGRVFRKYKNIQPSSLRKKTIDT